MVHFFTLIRITSPIKEYICEKQFLLDFACIFCVMFVWLHIFISVLFVLFCLKYYFKMIQAIELKHRFLGIQTVSVYLIGINCSIIIGILIDTINIIVDYS